MRSRGYAIVLSFMIEKNNNLVTDWRSLIHFPDSLPSPTHQCSGGLLQQSQSSHLPVLDIKSCEFDYSAHFNSSSGGEYTATTKSKAPSSGGEYTAATKSKAPSSGGEYTATTKSKVPSSGGEYTATTNIGVGMGGGGGGGAAPGTPAPP